MTYLEPKRRSNTKIITLITVVVFIVFILIQIFIPHIFSAIFTSMVAPFWRAEFSIESGSLSSPSALLRENEALKQELSSVLARMNVIEYIDFENSELRSQMSRGSSTTPHVSVVVLKRPPFSSYDELIIDAGLDRNISTTSTVYANGNIPIGRVFEVSGQTSKVILFSSPNQKQEVLIGPTHIPATAIGRGGGQYEVELPRGLQVNEGDFVILASSDTRPIGKVVSISSDSAEPFQKILFSPPINIYELRWVSVDVGGKKR
ncbi:MAG: rod shape-determining protein MreC [Candidatus Paceibacterota bacterium]|jgi:cell shape-determining protein MreC